jgi:hypothetical protein
VCVVGNDEREAENEEGRRCDERRVMQWRVVDGMMRRKKKRKGRGRGVSVRKKRRYVRLWGRERRPFLSFFSHAHFKKKNATRGKVKGQVLHLRSQEDSDFGGKIIYIH